MAKTTLRGNLVDIPARRMYAAEVTITEGRISKITELSEQNEWGPIAEGGIDLPPQLPGGKKLSV